MDYNYKSIYINHKLISKLRLLTLLTHVITCGINDQVIFNSENLYKIKYTT